MITTQGVVYIHSAPSALCPHIEWALAGVLDVRIDADWLPQPVDAGTYRTEMAWTGPIGTAAKLASSMRGWESVRYEVTEQPVAGNEGARYCYTPSLGIFHAPTGTHGDLMIPEDRIKAAMVRAARGEVVLEDALEELLGHAWDVELEPFRHAGDDVPVRWLHHVV